MHAHVRTQLEARLDVWPCSCGQRWQGNHTQRRGLFNLPKQRVARARVRGRWQRPRAMPVAWRAAKLWAVLALRGHFSSAARRQPVGCLRPPRDTGKVVRCRRYSIPSATRRWRATLGAVVRRRWCGNKRLGPIAKAHRRRPVRDASAARAQQLAASPAVQGPPRIYQLQV